MKKFATILMLTIFALNATLGIAGGVLLCMHSHQAHIELASTHECVSNAISESQEKNLSQHSCDHIGDFILIADGSSAIPRILSENLKTNFSEQAAVEVCLFIEKLFEQKNISYIQPFPSYVIPPDKTIPLTILTGRFLI